MLNKKRFKRIAVTIISFTFLSTNLAYASNQLPCIGKCLDEDKESTSSTPTTNNQQHNHSAPHETEQSASVHTPCISIDDYQVCFEYYSHILSVTDDISTLTAVTVVTTSTLSAPVLSGHNHKPDPYLPPPA